MLERRLLCTLFVGAFQAQPFLSCRTAQQARERAHCCAVSVVVAVVLYIVGPGLHARDDLANRDKAGDQRVSQNQRDFARFVGLQHQGPLMTQNTACSSVGPLTKFGGRKCSHAARQKVMKGPRYVPSTDLLMVISRSK